MPATMAGSRGGTIGYTPNSSGRGFIRSLLTGRIAFNELYNRFKASSCPRNVTLVVNNVCNLHCPHCYLQVEKLTASALTEKDWEMLINSIARVNPELVCLSGKEVFVGEMGLRVLSYLREAKNRHQASYRIGLITNGTLVERHRNDVLQAQPSYLDISLDGIERDHDAVRDKGTFAVAFTNIKWGAQTLGEKFFVNLTLQKQNFSRLKEAIDLLQQHGVRNISCGFYRPLPYTVKHLALSEEDLDFIFENLLKLEDISLQRPLKILMDLDIVTLQPLRAFLRSRWFSIDKIHEDMNGEHYIEYRFRNGIGLEIRFAPYPTGVWRSVRITPEGNYLAAEDTIDTTRYGEYTIGNVRDFHYNFAALQAYALASARFKDLLFKYYNDILPDLIETYCQHHLLGLAA